MPKKRLVFCVEGKGDVASVPALVEKILKQQHPGYWDWLHLDENQPVRIGNLVNLVGKPDNQRKWTNRIEIATKRRNVGGVLVVLDGDHDPVEGRKFCPGQAAAMLADRAKAVRAGEAFSLALVFAMKEYEAWLGAGIGSLAGQFLDGREGVKHGATPPEFDVENHRDMKRWLADQMPKRYNPAIDQLPLTRLLDLDEVRARNLRSFSRLERAVAQLVEAIRTGQHVCTPTTNA